MRTNPSFAADAAKGRIEPEAATLWLTDLKEQRTSVISVGAAEGKSRVSTNSYQILPFIIY